LTKDAFERLDSLYGTYKKPSSEKNEYRLPKPLLTNADLSRIINSDEVQGTLREKIPQTRNFRQKKNPLRNLGALVKLNPYAITLRRRQLLLEEKQKQSKAAVVDQKRKGVTAVPKKVVPKRKDLAKRLKKERKQFYQTLLS